MNEKLDFWKVSFLSTDFLLIDTEFRLNYLDFEDKFR